MRLRILLLVLVLSPTRLFAYPTAALAGNLDRNDVARGSTITEAFTLTIGGAGFQGTLYMYLHTSEGLDLQETVIVPPVLTCRALTVKFKTCVGTNLSAGTIGVGQTLHVTNDAKVIQTFSAEVQAEFLSSTKLIVGLISVHDPKPHIFTQNDKLEVILTTDEEQVVLIPLVNDGDADGTATPKSAPTFLAKLGPRTIPHNDEKVMGFPANGDLKKGVYTGDIVISRTDDDDLVITVRVVVADVPSILSKPKPDKRRLDVTTPGTGGKSRRSPQGLRPAPNANPSATLTVENSGGGPVNGVFNADAPWIITPLDVVDIPANSSKSFDVAVDPARLPVTEAGDSSTFGTLTLTYLLPPGASPARLTPNDGTKPPSNTSNISVTIVATPKPSTTSTGIPPLALHCQSDGACWDETALIVPGVRRTSDPKNQFVSDLKLFPKSGFGDTGANLRSIGDVDVYFTPLKAPMSSAKKVSIPSVPSPALAAMGDVISNFYSSAQDVGTLQVRAPGFLPDDIIGLHSKVTNVSGAGGTYGFELPAFRSYNATTNLGLGNNTFLTGLRKDSGGHSEIILQESLGSDITANVDFYDASGKKLGSTSTPLAAFTGLQLDNALVPSGTISAVVSSSTAKGGVHALAIVVDDGSGDSYVVADWRKVFGYDDDFDVTRGSTIAVIGSTAGRNGTTFKTDLVFMNIGATAATGTIRYYNQRGSLVTKTVSANPFETKIYADATATLFGVAADNIGYATFTPGSNSRFVITARTYTPAGTNTTFSTTVPVSFSSGITTRPTRIAGVDDAAFPNIAAKQPGSWRSNMGLIETAGKAATVQVTISYRANAEKTSSITSVTKSYTLQPNQMIFGSLANVFGATRSSFGDLHDMTVDFSVTGGSGAVFPFITSVDNASGDSVVRLP